MRTASTSESSSSTSSRSADYRAKAFDRDPADENHGQFGEKNLIIRTATGSTVRAHPTPRIVGIPGGLGDPLGTDGGGGRGCEHVHPATVDVEDRAVNEGGLV